MRTRQKFERRASNIRSFFVATAFVCILGLVESIAIAEAEDVEASRVGSYRRLFVPADSPEEWPIGEKRYLPIKETKFEQLIEQQSERQKKKRSAVQITGATYYAELVDDQLLVGHADLELKTSSKQSRLQPLSPLNLSITSASWKQHDEASAEIGIWQRPGQQPKMAVMVTQSDILHLNWQLRARVSNSSSTDFRLELPLVVPQSLSLVLPKNHSAVLNSGELLRTEELSNGKMRWWFQLAPTELHPLKILRQSLIATQKTLPLATQSTIYQFDPKGLTIHTTLNLGADESSLGDLVFAVSGGAKVVSVTKNQQTAAWRVDESSNGIQLVVPRSASRLPMTLEIRSLAQMQFDQTWQLPLLRLRDVSWSLGTARLLVSPGLELRWLVPRQASLQRIEGLDQKQPGEEEYILQEWSEDSSVEVVVSRSPSQLQIRAATTIDVDPKDSEVGDSRSSESTAQIVVDLICKGPPVYQLEAEVSAGWSIESIKTVPSSALGEWHLLEDSDRRLIRIQLHEPVLSSSPLRLEIDSRFEMEGSLLPARVNRLSPLRFLTGRNTRNLLLLRSRQQGQMELLHGLDHSQLSAESLNAEDATLLPELGDGVLLDLTHLEENTLVELQAGRDRYDAEVRVEVRVLPDSFLQHYRIDCKPISGVVSELVVQFDQALPSEAQWKLVGHPGSVVAKRLEPSENEGSDKIESPAYGLQFPAVVDGPFSLEVQYSSPAKEKQTCNMLSLFNSSDWHTQVAEASGWRGQVVVRGPLDGVQVDDLGWTPIAMQETKTDTEFSLPVLGCYRIIAERNANSEPLVVRRQAGKSVELGLFAWTADIQSLHAADGDAIYVATYYLENTSSSGADIQLPEGAELQEAWLDQQHFEPREVLGNDRNCRFHFNSNRRYPTLAVQYLVRGAALKHSASLEPLLPECSFPVGAGRWTLWTPEQFTVRSSEDEASRYVSWVKRLFGPLSRSAGQSVFNPFRASSWKAIWSTPLGNLRNSRRAARLARHLARQTEGGDQQSWGDLILTASLATATNQLLLIDRDALRQQGIEAKTFLDEVSRSSSSSRELLGKDRSFNPLRSKELALVASKDSLLLTTDLRIAQWRDFLVLTDTQGVYSVGSPQLTSKMQKSSNRKKSFLEGDTINGLDFVGVEIWLATPNIATPPWKTNSSTLLAGVGRRAVTFDFIGKPPEIVVLRHLVQRAQWHVTWLLALTLSLWLAPRYTNRTAFFLAISAAACLLVPPTWLVWVQAIFLGLSSTFFLQIFLDKLSLNTPKQPLPRTTTRAAALVSLLLVVFACGQAYAEPVSDMADEKTEEQSKQLHQVLFPIDSNGNPQGEDVYVPELFLEQLNSTPKNFTRDGAQNVLVSALYRGALPVDPQNATGNEEPWSITIEAKSFVDNSELLLPFRRDEADWLKNAHRLDGLPLELRWNPNGEGCRLNLGAAGPHRLELKMKPKFDSTSNQVIFRLHVPRLPQARIDFAVPSDLTDLSIPSATQIRIDKATGRWQAPLTASGLLQMDWTPMRIRRESDAIGEVEQMAWLRVSSSDVWLDVQILVKHAERVPEQLVLAISEQLELLPLGESSPIKAIDTTEESPGLLVLKLKEDLGSQVRLQLRFRLRRSSPLGRIFYPRVRLQHAASVQSSFAVSVAQGFSYEESASEDLRSLPAEEFAEQWGTTEHFPLFAYSQTYDSPPGSLQVWPDPKTMVAQQVMRVHCDIRHVHIGFEAKINQTSGSWLSHRLWLPEYFLVESISVTRQINEETIPVRWSRVNRSQIVLFAGQPLDGAHTLEVHGFVEASREGELTLPAISLVGTERDELHVDLTREADVLVSWEKNQQASQDSLLATQRRTDTKIPAGKWSWRLSGAKAIETLFLEKNDQQFSADTLTTISQGTNGWKASLHATIHVQKGVLSQVTLSVPSGFRQPQLLKPEGLHQQGKVRETASGRQITFLLLEPVKARKSFELEIAGELDLPANQQLEVPHLQLMGSIHGKRYLLLPTNIQGRSVAWEWGDLKPTSLPNSLTQMVESQENTRLLLVKSNQFFAREQSYQGPLRNAKLRYALISGTLDRGGQLSATAELVIQPGRATHCTLRLPEGAELEQLVTGDRRMRREKVGNRSWRVLLGPPFLPRKIKVVYQLKTELNAQSVRLSTPEILIGDRPLPAPQTLWKIRLTGGLRLGGALAGRSLSLEQFARSAHQLPLGAIEASRLLALELPLLEGRAWFRPWQLSTQKAWDEWRALEPSANTILNDSAPLLLGNETQSEEHVEAWSALVDKLGYPETSAGEPLLSVSYPPALPVRSTSLKSSFGYHFISDREGQLIVATQTTTNGRFWVWLLVGLIGGVGFALVRQLQTSEGLREKMDERSSLLIIAAGFFWWIFLAPSVLGLLLVVLVLASKTFRRGRTIWERRRKGNPPLVRLTSTSQ